MRDAIAGEKQGSEARGEREVGDRGDVIVGEIDGVMVLRNGLAKGRGLNIFFGRGGEYVA